MTADPGLEAMSAPLATAPTDQAASGGTTGPPGSMRHQADVLLDDVMRRIEDRTARVVIVGQGYVGLPLAMRAVEVGFPVVGLEAAADRAAALQAGRSYVADVSDADRRRTLDGGYRPGADPEAA